MKLLTKGFVGVITLLLLFSSVEIMAQSDNDINELIRNAESHYKNKRNNKALESFLHVLELDSTNYTALHRVSLLYNMIGFQFEDEDQQMDHYIKAKDYAEKALQYHEGKPEAHYVYSIATGRISKKSRPRTRVGYANEIKKHAEKALELNPDHAGAWHVLGVWHHEASTLNFAERTAVRMFGGLPEASKEKAEEAFNKAISLDNNNILFYLDFAKFYEEMGSDEQAINMLEKAVALEPQRDGDEKHLEISKNFLASLK
ncbi:MAG: hypothetical protein WD267_04675 [Balneolales bacterium]